VGAWLRGDRGQVCKQGNKVTRKQGNKVTGLHKKTGKACHGMQAKSEEQRLVGTS
jgi:hypothetical protein